MSTEPGRGELKPLRLREWEGRPGDPDILITLTRAPDGEDDEDRLRRAINAFVLALNTSEG